MSSAVQCLEELESALSSAERAANDAASSARECERAIDDARDELERLRLQLVRGGCDLSAGSVAEHVLDLVAVCWELAAPMVVWDESFAERNLERLVSLMREYARKAASA